MKRIVSLVLCFVMVLSLLTGCGSSNETTPEDSTVENPGVSDTGAMAAGTTGATYTPIVEAASYK